MNDTEIKIGVELTPNPNSLKFVVNRTLIECGTAHFPNPDSAKDSLLPAAIFEVESIAEVLIGTSFITITKKEGPKWDPLIPPLFEKMKTVLNSGEKHLLSEEIRIKTVTNASDPTEKRIREVLDLEIRPAVARDGGDIVFQSFENGVVKLHLQGACSTCPSSLMTLRLGVEARLKALIPEIREVVQA